MQFNFFPYLNTNGIVTAFILRIALAGDIENNERKEDAAETSKIYFIVSKMNLRIRTIYIIYIENKIKIGSVIFEILMKNMRAHQIASFCPMKLREGRFVA